jgi:hypothetical protein
MPRLLRYPPKYFDVVDQKNDQKTDQKNPYMACPEVAEGLGESAEGRVN